MWDDPITYLILGVGLIAAVLTRSYWGDWVYVMGRNWKGLSFIAFIALTGILGVTMQQDLKYKLAYSYFSQSVPDDSLETEYYIRQCKEFLLAKASGQNTIQYHEVSAGPVTLTKINYYDFCARTFGLNFWRHDISINGQDGGRLLCDTYAHDTYRSGRVQSWCDTVFAPRTESEASAGQKPAKDRGA